MLSELRGLGSNPFGVRHAARVPYEVRCVASNLERGQARQLRDLLVSEAPGEVTRSNGTTVQAAGCWLAAEDSAGGGIPFHELGNLGLFGTESGAF